MTAVVFARTQAEAEEAALSLGLTSWVWPRWSVDLPAAGVDQLIYVEGWRAGISQSVGAGYAAMLQLDDGAEELEQPTTADWIIGPFVKLAAADELAARRRRAKLGPALTASPFIDPGTIAQIRPRPRSWWARLTRRRNG